LILKTSARFEVLVGVTVDIAVLWDIMSFSQVEIYILLETLLPQRCGSTFFQNGEMNTARKICQAYHPLERVAWL
jgi:hypothetical protein